LGINFFNIFLSIIQYSVSIVMSLTYSVYLIMVSSFFILSWSRSWDVGLRDASPLHARARQVTESVD